MFFYRVREISLFLTKTNTNKKKKKNILCGRRKIRTLPPPPPPFLPNPLFVCHPVSGISKNLSTRKGLPSTDETVVVPPFLSSHRANAPRACVCFRIWERTSVPFPKTRSIGSSPGMTGRWALIVTPALFSLPGLLFLPGAETVLLC